jgi:hypothetical protein
MKKYLLLHRKCCILLGLIVFIQPYIYGQQFFTKANDSLEIERDSAYYSEYNDSLIITESAFNKQKKLLWRTAYLENGTKVGHYEYYTDKVIIGKNYSPNTNKIIRKEDILNKWSHYGRII